MALRKQCFASWQSWLGFHWKADCCIWGSRVSFVKVYFLVPSIKAFSHVGYGKLSACDGSYLWFVSVWLLSFCVHDCWFSFEFLKLPRVFFPLLICYVIISIVMKLVVQSLLCEDVWNSVWFTVTQLISLTWVPNMTCKGNLFAHIYLVT
jgi:hypothetical protein